MLSFVLDQNLGLPTSDEPSRSILTAAGIFGRLNPYYYADVHSFFHDLDQLPAGI